MEQNKRGQAALEFLLTYSWAILVVIVIIGALAYFGVLNPQNFIPEKCTFSAGISCTDYVYSSGALTIRIVNGLGNSIQIQSFDVSSFDMTNEGVDCEARAATTVPNPADPIAPGNILTLANGASADVTFTNCGVIAGIDKMRASIDMSYIFAGGIATPKVLSGEVFVNTQQ